MRADTLKIVGERIGAERKALGLTQSELASRIGITMSRLANYEDGSGCLRCGIAFDICRNLVISEQWLATGKGDKNCYRGVVDEFPKKLLNKSFLALYELEIEPLYERAGYPDSFITLLRYDDMHPDTWRIACFKMQKDYASRIDDPESRSWYWMEMADYAGQQCFKYLKPPHERLAWLNSKLSILENGKTVPFSYEKFYNDLSLIGLHWHDIESIAENFARPPEAKNHVFSTEKIREEVLNYLEICDMDNAAALYRKIHCKN